MEGDWSNAEQKDDGLVKIGAREPKDRKVVPNREPSLFRSVRFHSAMVAFAFVPAMGLVTATYNAFGGLSLMLMLFLSGALGGITNTYIRLRDIPADEQKLLDPITNKLAIIQVYIADHRRFFRIYTILSLSFRDHSRVIVS